MLRANVRTQNKKSGRERIVRRQTELGGHSAGSSRTARLDPLALPVRFTASDAVADEPLRHVELHRERVILRRAVQGMRIALNVPVKAFRGVSIRLIPEQDEPAGRRRRSISSTSIRRSRSSFTPRKTPTTSLPNGNCGRACSACRRSSPAATASSARRSRSSAPCASRRRRSAAAAVRRSASAARSFSRAAVPA